MAAQRRHGRYQLVETRHSIKILSLDDAAYAWTVAGDAGELLATRRQAQPDDAVLSAGRYRLTDRRDLTGLHLELEAGQGIWQEYLLPTGLPDAIRFYCRIRPAGRPFSLAGGAAS